MWRWVLAGSAVAAVLLVIAGAARLYRPVPPPPVVALARPPAPAVAVREVLDLPPAGVTRRGRKPAARARGDGDHQAR